MKSKFFILFALLFVFFAGSLYSQQDWKPNSKYNKLYDVNTVETISGQVVSVDRTNPDKKNSYGIHLVLRTSEGDITVHLGPGWYIDEQTVKISTDDNVTVTGSKITYEGSQIIIAKEVTKGNDVLKLRDDNGYPLWSGWQNK